MNNLSFSRYLLIDTDDLMLTSTSDDLMISPAQIQFLSTAGKTVDEILIELDSLNFDRVILTAELEIKDRGTDKSPGLEILKHLRLTNELGAKRGVPVLLLHWFPITYYFEKSADNFILYGPNTFRCLFTKIEGEAWLKATLLENFDALLRPFVIFDAFDGSQSEHDFRNNFGAKSLALALKRMDDPSSQVSKSEILAQPLWLKKHYLLHVSKGSVLEREIAAQEESLSMIQKFFQFSDNERLNILWIDDQHTEWKDVMLEVLIRTCGARNHLLVEYVGNFDDALSIIRDEKQQFDLVILDMRVDPERDRHAKDLTSLSGIKLLHEIQWLLPTICFSASEKAHLSRYCLDFGVDAFFTKGISSVEEILLGFRKATVKALVYKRINAIERACKLDVLHWQDYFEHDEHLVAKIRFDLKSCVHWLLLMMKADNPHQVAFIHTAFLTMMGRLADLRIEPGKEGGEENSPQQLHNEAYKSATYLGGDLETIGTLRRTRNRYVHHPKFKQEKMASMIELGAKSLHLLIELYLTKIESL